MAARTGLAGVSPYLEGDYRQEKGAQGAAGTVVGAQHELHYGSQEPNGVRALITGILVGKSARKGLVA